MCNKKDYISKFLLLPIIIITFIAIICLIPNNEEKSEIIYTETTEISTEATYNKESTDVAEEILVWISKTGERYHSIPDCSNMKNPLQVTIEEAEIREYTPCMRCY